MKRFLLVTGPQGSGKSQLVNHITPHAPTAFVVYDPFEPDDVDNAWDECDAGRSIIAVVNDMKSFRERLRGKEVARFEVLLSSGTRADLAVLP